MLYPGTSCTQAEEKQSPSPGMKGVLANTTRHFLLRGGSYGTGSSATPWHGDRTGRGWERSQLRLGTADQNRPVRRRERGTPNPGCARGKPSRMGAGGCYVGH